MADRTISILPCVMFTILPDRVFKKTLKLNSFSVLQHLADLFCNPRGAVKLRRCML